MLTLPIKKQWFDMISSGEKREEYRDDTEYYAQRFAAAYNARALMYICLHNGYRADSPKLYCIVKPELRTGARPEWGGAPDKRCWVLSIIEVIKNTELEKAKRDNSSGGNYCIHFNPAHEKTAHSGQEEV